MKIIDKIGKIDEKYIEKAIMIDNDEKLMGEKLKKNRNKNRNFNWKLLLAPAICVCIVIISGIALKNYKPEQNKDLILNVDKRYLDANYALMMYENAFKYIPKNVDLNSLKENETIKLEDKYFIDTMNEEYKSCSGSIYITKNKYNIYENKFVVNCDNTVENSINLTMKVYTNINQNSTFQIINDFTTTDDGYTGLLDNYNVTLDNDGSGSFDINGVSGVIDFTKDLDISDIKLFDNNIEGFATSLRKLSNGYLLEQEIASDNYLITYCDNDLNKIWDKLNGNFNIQDILYETEEEIIFSNVNDEDEVGEKLYSMSKKDGSIKYKFTFEADDTSEIWIVDYNDNIFYGCDPNNPKIIYVYDLNGKVIKKFDTKDYYKRIEGHPPVINVSNNLMLFENDNFVYVINKDGNVINTIELKEVSGDPAVELLIADEYYEIIYNSDVKNNTVSEKLYSRYDLNHKLIFRELVDMNYGYSTLKQFGLTNEYEFFDILSQNSSIIDGKVIERAYYPDNNGTLLMMMFDYNDSTNIKIIEDDEEYIDEVNE